MNRLANPEYLLLRNLDVSTRLITNHAMRVLKSCGITIAQAQVLFIISEQENSSQESIACALHIARTAVRLTLHQLIDGGYVNRMPDASDKRIHRLGLTEKGKSMIPVFDELVRDSNLRVLSCLTEYEQIVFLGLLQKVQDCCLSEFLDNPTPRNK